MGWLYEHAVKRAFFRLDPEHAHEIAVNGLARLGGVRPLCALLERVHRLDPAQHRPVEAFGLKFPNAVGLAAGFDKNGRAWPAAAALGFGHVEIGTVTFHAQPGNPRPRAFRYPAEQAVINRMGFNNEGAAALAAHLAKFSGPRSIPLGINLGKSKVTSLDQATGDYLGSFRLLADHGDYIAVNVSSPNTPGLRELQDASWLKPLLAALVEENKVRVGAGKPRRPLLLKIAPDLTFPQIDAALQAGARTDWTEETWVPSRDQAYLGVLVDDLITKGVSEPYRMFTSRAEFRLQLREDNADLRLTEVARQLGLVDDARWTAFCRKRDAVSRETERLRSIWVSPKNLAAAESVRVLGKAIDHEYNLADLLRRPDVSYPQLMSLDAGKYAEPELMRDSASQAESVTDPEASFAQSVIEQVEIAAKYSGYIDRQRDEVSRAAYYEYLRLPEELDYMQVSALSIEARQKLNRHRPETLGLASRISGITPATISLLLIHLKRSNFKQFSDPGKADLSEAGEG